MYAFGPDLLPFALAAALCAARWLPVLMLVPLFASHAMSAPVRMSVALALACPVALAVLSQWQPAPPDVCTLLLLIAKESGIGLLLAVLLAIPLWAIEAAGTCIDFQRGANPQALDPAASPDASILGAMLQQASCVYLIHAGALHALLAAVYSSFALWPPLQWMPALSSDAWHAAAALLSPLMRYAMILALPCVLALALVEACFALLSRASPRFPAYVAALPFKSLLALMIVALTLASLLETTHAFMLGQIQAVAAFVKLAVGPAP